MSPVHSLDRRSFLLSAGAAFTSVLSKPSHAALVTSETVFASAIRSEDGSYGLLLFGEYGDEITRLSLPTRGHDIAFSADGHKGVVFARRPGNFALVFDVTNKKAPLAIATPPNRHFYGHGVFSKDGKLLYASENDFENAVGVIGIYDATDSFKRIGEFSSYGIGPHEILLHPQENILIVANGGIETHPDFGRAKLNIPQMQSSLTFIDLESGALIERHGLPNAYQKLSIRHMDVSQTGKIVFGCQYEGSKTNTPPLIGSVEMGEQLTLWNTPKKELRAFANYVGSVALNLHTKQAAITLPKGNKVAIYSMDTKSLVHVVQKPQSFGISNDKNGFLYTTATGIAGSVLSQKKQQYSGIAFDNHVNTVLRP
ncbi:MAG: DUF1513 domain-containing protein [Pseudomonadota bacterium]